MNHDRLASKKEERNQPKKFTLWDAPLLNHFQGILNYDLHELDDSLYARYEQSNHPAVKHIQQLLKATSKFLHQTVLEKDFSQSNIESKSDDDWEKVFRDITMELKTAQELCGEEIKNTTGYLVFEAAIKYCKKLIADQLKLIEASTNIIHTKYTNYGGELKNIIPTPFFVNLKH